MFARSFCDRKILQNCEKQVGKVRGLEDTPDVGVSGWRDTPDVGVSLQPSKLEFNH
jgi:hypothetical protein